jgi:hypothetical protein
MLRVIVELVPFGIGEPQELGRLIIANDGTHGPTDLGSYEVRLGRKGQQDDHTIYRKPVREGRVENHRRNAEPVWSLVAKALRSIGF